MRGYKLCLSSCKLCFMSRAYAFLLSFYLLVEGVCELMARDLVFGVFTTNTLHAVVHLVLGMVGLFLGAPRNPKVFNSSVGLLLFLVGILFFIPGINGWLISLFNLNKAVAYFNILLGVLSLLMAQTYRKPVTVQ